MDCMPHSHPPVLRPLRPFGSFAFPIIAALFRSHGSAPVQHARHSISLRSYHRFCLPALLIGLWAFAAAAPAQETAPGTITLAPGEYLWMPELAPDGPLVMVISLPQQLGYVYRNGVRIGVTTVSTGRSGYETPPGVYSILQKRVEHYSNRYDSAPMPFMQRLTWDGVALHAGHVTGKPASHGCIRLPRVFAGKLYAVTTRGMIVIVADQESPAPALASPGFFAPVSADSGKPRGRRFSVPQRYHLSPELAPEGPMSVLISSADAAVVVIRNGVEIARARIDLAPDVRFGLHAFVMLEGTGDGPSAVVPDRPAHRWLELAMPDHDPPGHARFDAAAMRAMNLPPVFASRVYQWLVPGTTVIVTDDALEPRPNVTVLDSAEGVDASTVPDP